LPVGWSHDTPASARHLRKALYFQDLRWCERVPGFRRHLASRIDKGLGIDPGRRNGVEAEDAICRSNVPIGP
jgi:hypothetical protein